MAEKQPKEEQLDTKIASDQVEAAAEQIINAVKRKSAKPKEDSIVPTTYKNPENTEGLVEIMIDPVMTRGGLMTNGTRYIGRVKVPTHVADDLMRRQEEIMAVANFQTADMKAKPKLKIQNHQMVEQQYLADPENRGRKGWTDEYGLLDPWQWQWLSPSFQDYLKETRKQMYGL